MKRIPGLALPKEHGAWAMLYVPFVLGVVVAGRVVWPTLWALLAMTALFFAREALRRLRRARQRKRPVREIQRSLAVESGALVLCAGMLLLHHRLYGFLPLGLGAVLVLAFNLERAEQREDRSLVTELLAIVGFAMAAPAAYYASAGVWRDEALWLWGLCWAYFASSVFHVKQVVLSVQPRRLAASKAMRRWVIAYHAALLLSLVCLVTWGASSPWILCAFAPILWRSAWALVRRPARLDLRRIGILEIVYSVTFLVFTALAFRTPTP